MTMALYERPTKRAKLLGKMTDSRMGQREIAADYRMELVTVVAKGKKGWVVKTEKGTYIRDLPCAFDVVEIKGGVGQMVETGYIFNA